MRYPEFKFGYNLQTVILGAILLRVLLFIIFKPWNLEFETHELFFYDPQEYHELAKAMLNWDFLDNTIRTPGYPAFVAFFYKLFGVHPWVVYAAQMLLNIFSVYMTYRISRLFLGEKTSVLAASLLAIDPHLILFSFNLLSEALFLPVILVMTYYLIRYFQTNALKFLIFASLSLAISAYIRPVTLYLPIALIPLFLILVKGDFTRKAKSWGLLAVIVFLVLSPWYYRNYSKFDTWSFCTTGGYNILYVYAASVEYTKGGEENMENVWASVGARVDSIAGGARNPFAIEKAQIDLGLYIIKKDPIALVQNHLIGVFNIFFSISSYRISQFFGIDEVQLSGSYYGTTNASKIGTFLREKGFFSILLTVSFLFYFFIQYSTAILGAIALARQKRFILLFTFLFLILYLVGLTGPFGFQARFKIPLMPFYMIFSAYGMGMVKDWYLGRKQRTGV